MEVGIGKARKQLPHLIRTAEQGEAVVITRHGKPVAVLSVPDQGNPEIILGGMKDQIELYPGWDDPVDLDEFLNC